VSIRLVLADDHPLVLQALDILFRQQEGFEILAACHSGTEAKHAIRELRPDVAVLDLHMPGGSGLDVLREIAADHLPTKIVLLTAIIEDEDMLEALRLGVSGVVLKNLPSLSIVQCVKKVLSGERWLEMRSASRMLEKLVHPHDGSHQKPSSLTDRELEIVHLLGQGLRNKEIASRLAISTNTVKVHLTHVYDKVGVAGRVALMRYAEANGLI
jgi:DNA-binding NarL/FixJ family response regulator